MLLVKQFHAYWKKAAERLALMYMGIEPYYLHVAITIEDFFVQECGKGVIIS